MVASFVTYANSTAMAADTSQPDGTYAQLVSDMAAGKKMGSENIFPNH